MRAGRPRSQEMPITPPLRGSRRSRAAKRRLMRWGTDAGRPGCGPQPVQPLQGRNRSSPSEQRFMRLKASIMSVMSWPGQTIRNPSAARSSASLGLLVT